MPSGDFERGGRCREAGRKAIWVKCRRCCRRLSMASAEEAAHREAHPPSRHTCGGSSNPSSLTSSAPPEASQMLSMPPYPSRPPLPLANLIGADCMGTHSLWHETVSDMTVLDVLAAGTPSGSCCSCACRRRQRAFPPFARATPTHFSCDRAMGTRFLAHAFAL